MIKWTGKDTRLHNTSSRKSCADPIEDTSYKGALFSKLIGKVCLAGSEASDWGFGLGYLMGASDCVSDLLSSLLVGSGMGSSLKNVKNVEVL